jgi:hypothetical protein
MIAGGNWWRANEIVIRRLTRQTKARHRSRDKAIARERTSCQKEDSRSEAVA